MKRLRCIACDLPCGTITARGSITVNGATTWSSGGGSYGSTVHDCDTPLYLALCDGCLVQRVNRCVAISKIKTPDKYRVFDARTVIRGSKGFK